VCEITVSDMGEAKTCRRVNAPAGFRWRAKQAILPDAPAQE